MPAPARQLNRARDWAAFPTLLSFLAGLLTNFQFQFGGKVSAGELVLLVVAMFATIANIGNPKFWNRRMFLILFALLITFGGYIVADLVNSTPPDKLFRGWARMTFLIIDFFALWALTRRNLVNLLAVCFGGAFSFLLTSGGEHMSFLGNYKFHLAVPITVIVMILIPMSVPRHTSEATGVAMISVGLVHIWFDTRMTGVICIIIGFLLSARYLTASRLRSLYLSALAIALIGSSIAIASMYSATNEEFASRRAGSNSERMSLILTGISAIERAPVLGLGSWAWDDQMWNVFSSSFRASTYRSERIALNAHSQIIQAWAEAGLLGLVFFVYYGGLLGRTVWILFFKRQTDILTPLFLYFILAALWDLFCSPFANLHRFYIALALVIAVHVLRERESTAAKPGMIVRVQCDGN